ncbi:GNAT family N-acetyltransferase [Gracilinema caldarium]|uniref:GCN5-related N-acetyltransferase n=1 Tax=Gracilinema caldarium (strain ATCC 51460 / DSM 7334 / H1) TaxID=744872 RepID=F8F3B7_GRAC1|nr:N-acetyltransferase [Gracilinema caldarium]AEJ20954.1 GCN5-related N-acetyltransferase [Gracilinema caldarium DSM 7334]
MNIRTAETRDYDDIRRLYLSAFPESENEIVAKLATDLLFEHSNPPIIALAAEIDGSIVGHIAFSPVRIDTFEQCQAYILAPLAVKPDFQKQGIGSALITYGMEQLSDRGVHIVFVYGDPNYYGRFGFKTYLAQNYKTPYPLQYPFGWQAITICECNLKNSPASIHCVSSLCDPLLW